ncbi:ErpK protein [Eubacterium ramulus]|uniref:ErpK protein n=1 Tax=Eubacterium ramulus TaxID=39490 RepID=UPI0022E1D9D2|nr:ErpK protein [Eubacterium ramulus]
MARNISKESLTQKIAKTEKAISRNREQYERLTAELEELHKKQKAIQSEELLKAIETSSKSYEEILDFIQGKGEKE